MKKFFAVILVFVVVSMSCVSSFAMHVARDGVSAYDESRPQNMGELITQPGGNNPDTTELGDISERQLDYIIVHGWYAFEVPLKEFGYRIDYGEPVLGSPKYYGSDKELIDSQAAGLNCAESVRFQIVVPVYVGKDVVITPVALDEDDEVHDMPWEIVYTSTVGITPEPTKEPTPTPEATPTPVVTPTPTAAPTAVPTAAPTAAPTEAPSEGGCGSTVSGGLAVFAMLSAAVLFLRKRTGQRRAG